jgi:hypothetical protein
MVIVLGAKVRLRCWWHKGVRHGEADAGSGDASSIRWRLQRRGQATNWVVRVRARWHASAKGRDVVVAVVRDLLVDGVVISLHRLQLAGPVSRKGWQDGAGSRRWRGLALPSADFAAKHMQPTLFFSLSSISRSTSGFFSSTS